MSNNPVTKDCPVSAEQVADYLNRHRDFFADRPSLLADMHLTHDSGDAISLVERQVAILRERTVDMRQRMSRLLDNARYNDALFKKIKQLVLKLLDAKGLSDTINTLLHSFHSDFGIQYIALLIYGEHTQKIIADGVRFVPLNEVREHLDTYINNNNVVCGQLSAGEQKFIFAGQAPSIHSTAVIPLKHHTPVGLLAIGSDTNYFHSGMDTLFLRYIGDILACLLQNADASFSIN